MAYDKSIKRCGNCEHWTRKKYGNTRCGVCMKHSVWIQDTRKPTGTKRSIKGKPRFKAVITRHTNICDGFEPKEES